MEEKDRIFISLIEKLKIKSPGDWKEFPQALQRPELITTLESFTIRFFPYKKDIDISIIENKRMLIEFSENLYQQRTRELYNQILEGLREYEKNAPERLNKLFISSNHQSL